MMNILLAILAVTISCALGYDEKYDKLDVDKIINDDALFDAYLACLLDKGSCEAEHSKDFRELLPEVISTACAKCNKIQRGNVRKTVKAIQDKRPNEFKEFTKKYDADGKHQEAFAAFLVGTD